MFLISHDSVDDSHPGETEGQALFKRIIFWQRGDLCFHVRSVVKTVLYIIVVGIKHMSTIQTCY